MNSFGQDQHRRLFAVAMLILMLLVVVTWLIYALVTSQARLVVWDFHPPWTGVRAMLREGANPYSEEVTQRIQMEMLGRLPGASEDQYAFVYPLHLMVLIGPLALLPLPAAQAVWFSFLVMGLVTFILAAQRAVGWHPSRWLLSLTALFAVGLYSTVWALVLGQLAIVVAAFIALAWWNLRAGRWTVAGVCLALATVKPQMSFLFVPSVVLWAALRRRWILIASFGGSLLLLCLVPVPWMPAWPVAWIRAMMDYSVYAPFAAPLTTLTGSSWPAVAVAAATVAWVAYRWRAAPGVREEVFTWGLSMLLAVSALAAPRTSHVNQLVLLLPLFFLFRKISKESTIAGVEVGLLAAVWIMDFVFAPPTGQREHAMWQHRSIAPILPLALTGLLAAVGVRRATDGRRG